MAGYFITGTDTGVGKTCIALALMNKFKQQGKIVAGMKPVSAGCSQTNKGLRNSDAVQLTQASSIELPYNIVNPYAYEPPIAPHIAAQEAGEKIDPGRVAACYNQIIEQSEIVIVEGAGGWLVPINDSETMADLAMHIHLPVILVIGMRLGCLNHALLSVESIKNSGLTLAGWIANNISEQMDRCQENIYSLKHRIPAPLLGNVQHNMHNTADQNAAYLDFSALVNESQG